MSENSVKKPHMLTLDNRSVLSVTGVEDVVGFDDQTVNIRLSDSMLVVKGASLHISRLSLDSGEVSVDGRVSSLQYLGAASRNLRSKLFR